IGDLISELAKARRALQLRRAELQERTIRLESTLQASVDGIAMASRRDGQWVLEHASPVPANLFHLPSSEIEGQPLLQVFSRLGPILSDPDETLAWIEGSLAEPAYEGRRACQVLDSEAGATDDATPTSLIEIATRPVRDASGKVTGRMWVLH